MAESAPSGVPDDPVQGEYAVAAVAPGSQRHGHSEGEQQRDLQQRVSGRGQRAAAAEELLSQQRREDGDHRRRHRLSERGQVLLHQLAQTLACGGRFLDGGLHTIDPGGRGGGKEA